MSQQKLVVIGLSDGVHHIVTRADFYCVDISGCSKNSADFSERCLSADYHYCESLNCPHLNYCWPTYDGEEE